MKLDFKTILIAVLVLIIILIPKKCGSGNDTGVKQTTETTISYQTVIDSLNNLLMNQKPEKVPYYVFKDRIVPAKSDGKGGFVPVTEEGIDWIAGEDEGNEFDFQFLNVYKDSTKLSFGTVYNEITTDGKVFSNKVTAKFDQKITTTTKTTETTRNASGFFLSGGAGANTDLRIDNVNVGLDYISKNDFGVGVNTQYNLITNEPVFGVRVLKKVF
jgi:hypothetical protein